MVNRLQALPRGAVFVDLDGTLLCGNSMRHFMRRLPGMLLRKGAPLACLLSCFWLALRAAKLTSHRSMKWSLLSIAGKIFSYDDWARLAKEMETDVNIFALDYLKSAHEKGFAAYIASAAPEQYVRPLAHSLGLEGALSTPFARKKADYKELRGKEKLKAIQNLLRRENLSLEAFLTDHADDLPTAAAYPDKTILVAPSKESALAFRQIGVTRMLGS